MGKDGYQVVTPNQDRDHGLFRVFKTSEFGNQIKCDEIRKLVQL